MANPSGRKGADFETLMLDWIKLLDPTAIRRGKQGVKDKGDYYLPNCQWLVIEAKNEANYAGKLSGWLAEAEVERTNAGAEIGVVVHKRKGSRERGSQYVTMTAETTLLLFVLANETFKSGVVSGGV